VIDGGAAHHGSDAVAVAEGLVHPLEHQHAATLAASVAVGVGVEGLTSAVGRQRPGPGQEYERLGEQIELDATAERQVTIARA
jgi:hypothetical protein